MNTKKTLKEIKQNAYGPNKEAFKVVDEICQLKDAKWVLSYLCQIGLTGEALWNTYRVDFNGNSIDLYCYYRELRMKDFEENKRHGRY